jgi:hypothetical protein
MIEVYRIPIPKDRLRALPKDARVLLLLLGYVSNQVLMLQKLLIYATRLDPKDEVEQHATGVQTQMLVRIAVSLAFEAWRLIETRFLSNPLAKDYMGRLDRDGLQALEELKRHFGKSALLSAIRNNFGFHYPETADAEAAFLAAIPGLIPAAAGWKRWRATGATRPVPTCPRCHAASQRSSAAIFRRPSRCSPRSPPKTSALAAAARSMT